MNYLADLQERLSNGVTEEDIAKTVAFLKQHGTRVEKFPCQCHGERTAEQVITALETREDHWEEYVISILCGIAVSDEIKKSYDSTQSLADRLEGLLDLTRDFVVAVTKSETPSLFTEQLGAHFAIESALFRDKLVKMESEVEMFRRMNMPQPKQALPVN